MARVVAELYGTGRLETADGAASLSPVDYSIVVTQPEIDDGRGGVIGGLKEVRALVRATRNPRELVPYIGEAVLVLEDGRRWLCHVKGADGTLTNRQQDLPF